ncbi:MAG: LSU ribosomal protein L24p (L26e), partial [uncultured Sphingomonadaceae bacterium]
GDEDQEGRPRRRPVRQGQGQAGRGDPFLAVRGQGGRVRCEHRHAPQEAEPGEPAGRAGEERSANGGEQGGARRPAHGRGDARAFRGDGRPQGARRREVRGEDRWL